MAGWSDYGPNFKECEARRKARQAKKAAIKRKNRETWQKMTEHSRDGLRLSKKGEPRTVADVRKEAQERLLRKFVKEDTAQVGMQAFMDALSDPSNPAHGIALRAWMDRTIPTGMFEEEKKSTGITVMINRDGGVVLQSGGNGSGSQLAISSGNVIDSE